MGLVQYKHNWYLFSQFRPPTLAMAPSSAENMAGSSPSSPSGDLALRAAAVAAATVAPRCGAKTSREDVPNAG